MEDEKPGEPHSVGGQRAGLRPRSPQADQPTSNQGELPGTGLSGSQASTRHRFSDKAGPITWQQPKRANALKEVKRLCKEFGIIAGMLKGSLTEGRNEQ